MSRKSIPMISVVMAVYNGQRYLKQAVQSVLTQTCTDFEFIIINDGSTDDSGQILQKLAEQDERIHLISQENHGLTPSLNKGIALARGKYIARMDADDICLPQRFAKQSEFLEANPGYVAVGAEVLMIDPEGWAIGLRGHGRTHEEIDARLLLGDGGAMTHPVVMLKAETLRVIGGYREEFVTTQDLDLFLRLSEVGKLYNLPDVLLRWRQHPQSINHTRYQTWKQMKYKALRDTICRRNIALDLEQILAVEPDLKTDHRFSWAEVASRSCHPISAIKNYLLSLFQCGFRRYHASFVRLSCRDFIHCSTHRIKIYFEDNDKR